MRLLRPALTSAVALMAPIAPSAASAGTYDVYACRTPSGTVVEADGWLHTSGSEIRGNCTGSQMDFPRGFGAALSPQEVPYRGSSGVRFTAPRDTSIGNYTLYRFANASSGEGWARSYSQSDGSGSSMELRELCVEPRFGCSERGVREPELTEANRFDVEGIDAQQIEASVQCGRYDGREEPCPAVQRFEDTGYFTLFQARVGLKDLIAPKLDGPPTGTLLDSSDPLEGFEAATIRARDVGGGLSSATLLVDGIEAQRQAFDEDDEHCRTPFTRVVPCPLQAETAMVVDTTTISNGQHSLRIAVTDVGNNRVLSDPVIATVRNGSIPNGRRAGRFVRLDAWFVGLPQRRADRTVRFGRGARIAGRLSSFGGDPVAGAQLTVSTRSTRPGSPYRSAGFATTDERGRFSYAIGSGPSRRIRFGYRAFSLDPDEVASTTVALDVRAGVSLRANKRRVRTGRRVTFRGRLRGGPARGGTTVLLYALFPGAPRERIPVEALQADRRGRFRFTYRFRTTPRATTYRFAAFVRRQAGYPYAPGRSRILKIRVRP